MRGIFSMDSPVMRALSTLADIMLLNVLFLVTSLPVVTLGASLTALHGTAIRIVRDDCEGGTTRTYFRQFRSNFWRGTVLGLIAAGLCLVLGAWYVVINDLTLPGWLRLVFLGVLVLLGFRVLGTLLVAFGYQTTFTDPLIRVLGNARKISASHPLSTLQMVAMTVVPVVVFWLYPRLFLWGLVWAGAGFAAIALLNAVVLVRIFRHYGLDTEPSTPETKAT